MKDRCKVLGHRRGGISTEEQMHEKGYLNKRNLHCWYFLD